MKKILAMLMAMFISMFENVDYQYQAEVPFEHDAYYTVAIPEEEIDYRDLYGKQIAAGGNYSCVPTTYSVASYTVEYTDGATHAGAKWVVANEPKCIDDISGNEFMFTTDCHIICPYAGTLLTSSNTSDGTSMEIAIAVNNKNYRLYIDGMERWWCCEGKVTYDNPDNCSWIHTCNELKGTAFKAGNCLGRALPDQTTIKVVEDGNVVDLKEFFSN